MPSSVRNHEDGPMTSAPLLIEGQVGIDPAASDDARRQFRNTLGQFVTGVTAMTTLSPEGERVGITVSSFNSLSLDPPLILWSLARTSASFRCFQIGQPFAVNVLSAEQEGVARQFARVGSEKFEGIGLHVGLDRVPLIEGCVVYLECLTDARYPGGDHDIIVGRVRRIYNMGKSPLLFHGGILRALVGLKDT